MPPGSSGFAFIWHLWRPYLVGGDWAVVQKGFILRASASWAVCSMLFAHPPRCLPGGSIRVCSSLSRELQDQMGKLRSMMIQGERFPPRGKMILGTCLSIPFLSPGQPIPLLISCYWRSSERLGVLVDVPEILESGRAPLKFCFCATIIAPGSSPRLITEFLIYLSSGSFLWQQITCLNNNKKIQAFCPSRARLPLLYFCFPPWDVFHLCLPLGAQYPQSFPSPNTKGVIKIIFLLIIANSYKALGG